MLCCHVLGLCTFKLSSTHASNLKMRTSVSVKFMEGLYGMLYYNSSQYSQAYLLAIQIIHCIVYSLE